MAPQGPEGKIPAKGSVRLFVFTPSLCYPQGKDQKDAGYQASGEPDPGSAGALARVALAAGGAQADQTMVLMAVCSTSLLC